MKTAALTFILPFALVVLSARPACGQQEWSRPKSSSSATNPANPREMLSLRLQQLREGKSDNTERPQPSRTIESPLRPAASLPQDAVFPAIQPAHFEVTDNVSTTVLPGDLKSQIPDSAPPPFLDLTQENTAAVSTNENMSGNAGGAEVTLSSSPMQVLTRAVAWIVIALCLCSLTFLGLRRWQRQRGLLPTTNAGCRVLETLSLGPGRTVSLIEMAGFRALVASDAGGIRSLVLTPSNFQEELMEAGHNSEAEQATVSIATAA